MKIAKFISICIFITFCSCNNKGVYENCISFKALCHAWLYMTSRIAYLSN